MEHDQPHDLLEARLRGVLKKAATARRVAREFSYDPIAKRLADYADELMVEAAVIEADIQAASGET